ncbi:MAG: M14 family metallopeptidase [Candidatus Paceibacterota bacterium]
METNSSNSRKTVFIVVLALVILCIGVFAFVSWRIASKTPPVVEKNLGPTHTVIGQSVEGRGIDAYTYGNGQTNLLFVGGIHGGYEWNTVLLAYQFIDYLNTNPNFIPSNIKVTVIPSANPDGVFKVTGKVGRFTEDDVSTSTKILAEGRFNANKVDLNRNFPCNWKPTSTWQNKTVSAGREEFYEPEAQAISDFVLNNKNKISAVVFWHSQSNGVYASKCNDGILPGTLSIMDAYSKASGYPAVKSFDAYAISGAADDWLASINIPAVSVELKTHTTVEWEQNLAGIKALFDYFGQKKDTVN